MTPSPPSLRREKLRERRDCFWLDFDDARTSLFTEKDKVLNFVGEEIQIEFEDIEYTRVYLAREKIATYVSKRYTHRLVRNSHFVPPPKGFEEWNHREYLSKDKYVCEHNWTVDEKRLSHFIIIIIISSIATI